MGATDSKKIIARIDSEFKSLRKYCDPLYGEITVLAHKGSKAQYALIEKNISCPPKSFLNYIEARKNYSEAAKDSFEQKEIQRKCHLLIRLNDYFDCEVAMCSDIRNFFFLLEYSTHTLFSEISERQYDDLKFTTDELIKLFKSHVEIIMHLGDISSLNINNFSSSRSRPPQESPQRQKFPNFRCLVSNSLVIYDKATSALRALQPIFKCEPEGNQINFHHLQGFDEKREIYLSPQAYTSLRHGDSITSKDLSTQQPSVVFTLAMNFLECCVLANLSGVYDDDHSKVDYNQLEEILTKVRSDHGQQLTRMIAAMLGETPSKRMKIKEVHESLTMQQKMRVHSKASLTQNANSSKRKKEDDRIMTPLTVPIRYVQPPFPTSKTPKSNQALSNFSNSMAPMTSPNKMPLSMSSTGKNEYANGVSNMSIGNHPQGKKLP